MAVRVRQWILASSRDSGSTLSRATIVITIPFLWIVDRASQKRSGVGGGGACSPVPEKLSNPAAARSRLFKIAFGRTRDVGEGVTPAPSRARAPAADA
jgi:hypothetical protein